MIGDEITHGFDDQGRQYDGTGSLAPWWSEETIAAFGGKAQCFIDQYSNYTVPELIPILGEEDAHLNGENTQGENIADNGGIHESFRAYQHSVESQGVEPALPGLTQFTPEQMFFISNAQVLEFKSRYTIHRLYGKRVPVEFFIIFFYICHETQSDK